MKRNILLLTCLIGINLISCTPVLKTFYGVKKPKLENPATISEYLVKHRVEKSNDYVFNNLFSFASASQNELISIPDAIFFNKEGHHVTYKKSASDCNAKIDDFILDLNSFEELESDNRLEINNLTKLLRKTNGDKQELAKVNVFITWTMYSGRLNKKKAFEWVKLLQTAKSNGANVNYYLVNCDFQDSWGITETQKEQLGIR